MPEKAQSNGFGEVPDYEVAGFRKKLLEIYEQEPLEADKLERMLELVRAGVAPDTAAPACGIFHEWEEDEWFRQAVESAWARHKAAVMVNIGNNLKSSSPNASLGNLFLKAHCGFNEKSAEGWHQVIKLLPVVSAPAGIKHSPDRDYADIYAKRQEEAEKNAANAVAAHENAQPALEEDESGGNKA